MACNCVRRDTDAGTPVPAAQSPTTSYAKTDELPCGVCRSCRRIQAENHPDIIQVRPSGGLIRIARIRELCQSLTMKAYEARWRVAIICDAHRMNPQAANALLKMLEEPPDGTALVLTALQRSDLLPTIVSRCQHVRFSPLSVDTIAAHLRKLERLEPGKAWVLAVSARGSLSRAITLLRDNWIAQREWLLNELHLLNANRISPLLALAERLAGNRGLLPETLELINTWLRDLVICKFDPGKLINADRREMIEAASARRNTAFWLECLEALQKTQRDIQANLNPRLALEVLILRLAAG